MSRITTVIACVAMLAWSADAPADFKSEYFNRLLEKDAERLANIDDVLLTKEALGYSRAEYYEKTSSVLLEPGNESSRVMILNQVPITEIQRRHGSNPVDDMTPEQMQMAANRIEAAGRDAEAGVQQEVRESGFPPEIASQFMSRRSDDKLWLSANPADMGRMYGIMLRGAAEGKRMEAEMDAAEREAFEQQRQAAAALEHAGSMTYNGRPAERFVNDHLNMSQATDGMSMRFDSLEFIGDAEMYVPLLVRFEGEMNDGTETRPVRIELEERDYRRVDGCGSMYEPFQSVMRMSGMMTPEQEAEMAEAQAQMAQFEQQMAQMPKAQRDMIMRQMGPQMKMLQNMVQSGGIEIVENVVDMRCNEGLPNPLQLAQVTMGGAMLDGMASASPPDDDVRPYYVDDNGIGVIRYTDQGGSPGDFFLDVKHVSGGQEQVLAGGMGPYSGNQIGIYIGSLDMMGVPYGELELELYQQGPRRTAVRYRPEVDAQRAESKADCGTVSATGQCSN